MQVGRPYRKDTTMTNTHEKQTRKLLEAVMVAYATGQRDVNGDSFATEKELESIKSDPLAFDSILNGYPARELLRLIWDTARDMDLRVHEERERAKKAWR